MKKIIIYLQATVCRLHTIEGVSHWKKNSSKIWDLRSIFLWFSPSSGGISLSRKKNIRGFYLNFRHLFAVYYIYSKHANLLFYSIIMTWINTTKASKGRIMNKSKLVSNFLIFKGSINKKKTITFFNAIKFSWNIYVRDIISLRLNSHTSWK